MVNPYGDDDEGRAYNKLFIKSFYITIDVLIKIDFDLNWLINRHNKAINLGTDALCSQLPKMTRSLIKNPAASPSMSHCSVQSDQQVFTPFNTP